MPWLRHTLVDMVTSQADLYRRYGHATEVAVMTTTARNVGAGDLWWVSRDMTRVALDASTDMPAWTISSALPAPAGLLWWDGQLPPVRYLDDDTMETGDLRAIMWTLNGGRLVLVPVIRYGQRDGGWIMPSSLGISAAASSDQMPRHGTAKLPDGAGILMLAGATWTLMMEPQVAERRHRDMARRDVARATRSGMSTSPITVVDLRPMRTVTDPDRAGESGRHLHVRHVVRGHWRQQWYPSSAEHRPRWIASYLKGPDGAPIKASTPVMVWRR